MVSLFIQPFFGEGIDLIVTNLHVIHGAEKCSAKLFGQETIYEIEGYTAIDPENDLIILKVKDFDKSMSALNLGNSVSVHIGETIYAVGNPKGYEGTVSNGIVSGIRDADKLIQMTVPISQGSSGGPVINSNGEVIGVSVLSRSDGQNLNFAIPSVYVVKLITETEEHIPQHLLLAKLAGVTWVNEELTWVESEDIPTTYKFSLLNQRRYRAIREVHCLVIFKDDKEKPIHLDFVKFSEEIPAGEERSIFRPSMFDLDISIEGDISGYDINKLVNAAVVISCQRGDPNAYSFVNPEVKQLAKTYEVRVVNFEVVE